MFEKSYRIAIILLLAAILGVQAFAVFRTPAPSEGCIAALDSAAKIADIAGDYLDGALDEYDAAVYDRAENINQQIFLAGEQALIMESVAASMQQAELRVLVECGQEGGE